NLGTPFGTRLGGRGLVPVATRCPWVWQGSRYRQPGMLELEECGLPGPTGQVRWCQAPTGADSRPCVAGVKGRADRYGECSRGSGRGAPDAVPDGTVQRRRTTGEHFLRHVDSRLLLVAAYNLTVLARAVRILLACGGRSGVAGVPAAAGGMTARWLRRRGRCRWLRRLDSTS